VRSRRSGPYIVQDAKVLITNVLGIEVFMREDCYSFFVVVTVSYPTEEVLDELSAALEVPMEPGLEFFMFFVGK